MSDSGDANALHSGMKSLSVHINPSISWADEEEDESLVPEPQEPQQIQPQHHGTNHRFTCLLYIVSNLILLLLLYICIYVYLFACL